MDKVSIRELFKKIEENISSEVIENENYKEVKKREITEREMLESCLCREDLDLVEEYIEIQNEIATVEVEEAFVKGFSMAYQLLIDSIR